MIKHWHEQVWLKHHPPAPRTAPPEARPFPPKGYMEASTMEVGHRSPVHRRLIALLSRKGRTAKTFLVNQWSLGNEFWGPRNVPDPGVLDVQLEKMQDFAQLWHPSLRLLVRLAAALFSFSPSQSVSLWKV